MNHIQEPRSSCSSDFEQQQHQQHQNHQSDIGLAHPEGPIDGRGHPFDETDSRNAPTPRFMQEEGAWKRWKWVPYPARKLGRAVIRWMKGPQTPKTWKIEPLFPVIQHAPLHLLHRCLPNRKHRFWLFIAYFAAWILTFSLVLWQGQTASDIDGLGQPSVISCGATFWSKNNGCGVDGMNCRPFNGSYFPFRCPSNCDTYQTLNPRAVGVQEVVYAPLIIGGPSDPANGLDPVYRGDSFICGAAIHAGIISGPQGGCGVVSLVGQQQNYTGSERNGITSFGFDSYFPLSFTFLSEVECQARDVRWSLLAVSVVFTAVLSLFTASSAAFFFATFIIAFWQVGMASDRPSETLSVAGLFSNILGKFLPAMFCAWVFYDKMGVRRTLRGLTAQVEKTVLWLGACWVGALTNYTLDFIPIQRLTGHDLEQQPGAKAALAIIVIILVIVVVIQIWYFRQEGRLVRYLKLYALFILGIVISLALPGLNLRIHHYILALLLLPGTSMQTRPALLYQGVLVGLFINGIARWGYDPFLQTSSSLQNDAQLGSALPVILAPVINSSLSTITFQWESPPDVRYDGISILVNDVERFRGYFDTAGDDRFVWTRENGSSYNEYFRFGYMQGSDSADFTKAGIWNADMEWTNMESGASKVRRRHEGQLELVQRSLQKHVS
ncbi:LCCL domain-containing protein [Biscogniauxia mediterranea]|nr:LCCL domain-containing protein [Biscogniauxia mediterranea]